MEAQGHVSMVDMVEQASVQFLHARLALDGLVADLTKVRLMEGLCLDAAVHVLNEIGSTGVNPQTTGRITRVTGNYRYLVTCVLQGDSSPCTSGTLQLMDTNSFEDSIAALGDYAHGYKVLKDRYRVAHAVLSPLSTMVEGEMENLNACADYVYRTNSMTRQWYAHVMSLACVHLGAEFGASISNFEAAFEPP
jgi:hypothetical protein